MMQRTVAGGTNRDSTAVLSNGSLDSVDCCFLWGCISRVTGNRANGCAIATGRYPKRTKGTRLSARPLLHRAYLDSNNARMLHDCKRSFGHRQQPLTTSTPGRHCCRVRTVGILTLPGLFGKARTPPRLKFYRLSASLKSFGADTVMAFPATLQMLGEVGVS